MTKKLQIMIMGVFVFFASILYAETTFPSHDQAVCLAKVIYHESGNESIKGQIAVGEVIVNRLNAGVAKSVCAVVEQHIGQHWQFGSYVLNKNVIPVNRRNYFYEVAQQVLNQTSFILPPNVLYFNNALFDKTKYQLYEKIGHQYFFIRRYPHKSVKN